MRKLLAVLFIVAMVGGCALLKTVCKNGDVIKARIHSVLSIVQIGYPLVVTLANQTIDPNVITKVQIVDSALDVLGHLAYDVACPTPAQINTAQVVLAQAQAAKTELGIK